MSKSRNINKRVLYRWMLVYGDAFAIVNGFLLAYFLRLNLMHSLPTGTPLTFNSFIVPAVMMTFLSILLFAFSGLYSLNNARVGSILETFYSLAAGISTSMAVTLLTTFTVRSYVDSRLLFAMSWAATIFSVCLFRLLVYYWLRRERAKGRASDKMLIVGAGKLGLTLRRSIERMPWLGYSILGFVDDDPEEEFVDSEPARALLGSLSDLGSLIEELEIGEVIIALPSGRHHHMPQIISVCQAEGVRYRIVPDLYEMTLGRLEPIVIGSIPLIGVRTDGVRGWNQMAKRVLDIAVSSTTLVLLAPMMALIALAIKFDSPGPVLFRQRRVGQGGNPFEILKFRSMYQDAEKLIQELRQKSGATDPTFKMIDDPRITRVGRLIRRLSLDELPQLMNILKGDMSLVGPRPPIPYEVEMYEEWQKQRLEVVPGLTGLWQVSGRSHLSFAEMVKLDLYYIENWSLGLDMKIMLRTIPVVLGSHGAY